MTDQTPTLEGIILPAEPDGGALLQVQPLAAQQLFTTPTLVQALLAQVRTMAFDGFTPDLTTAAGRKAIASQAYKVAQTKTALDAAGKAVVDELKALPKRVDEGRKALKDGLDAIRDEVRQDLTTWEEKREQWKRTITSVQHLPATLFQADTSVLEERITALEGWPVGPEAYEEMSADASGVKTVTLATLRQMLEDRKKWEAEQAELKRLREAEEQRQREAQAEALRKEGEDRARKAMEAQQVQAQVPAEPATTTQAHQDPMPESQTTAAPQVQPPTPGPAAAALAPDVEHRRTFNREALADILPLVGGDEDMATGILRAIVTGKVRHVAITY